MPRMNERPNHCTACGDRLPTYFAWLQPPQSCCTLCRVLRPYQPGGRRYAPQRMLQQRVALASPGRLPAPTPESAARDALATQVVAWATAHANRWPVATDFRNEQGLPSMQTIRRQWGGLVQMREALHAQYPRLVGRRVRRWTPASICEAVATWMTEHPPTIPLVNEFGMDDALPSISVLHRHFQGLRLFYRVFQDGRYAEQCAQLMQTRQRAAGAKGRNTQQAARGVIPLQEQRQ